MTLPSSLSFRLSVAFASLLVAAAFAVGYLFDRGRTQAAEEREREHLRLHGERGADVLVRSIEQLRSDVLFLAGTPPVKGIGRALEGQGVDLVRQLTQVQWEQWLQQIFLSFAAARPQYSQLRLIGIADHGRELVRVEQTDGGPEVVPRSRLQQKEDRYYVRDASRLDPGSVYLSRIDLNQEHDQISVPHVPTLRAATPVHGPSGQLFGVVVVNLDLRLPFARAVLHNDPTEYVYIIDEQGDFLLHPEPGRAFAHELGSPFRVEDAFPGNAGRILESVSDGGAFLRLSGPEGDLVAFVTARAWDPSVRERRLILVLTEPIEQVGQGAGTMRQQSLLGMAILLAVAILLVILAVRQLTGSLRGLARASDVIAAGDYQVELPAARGEIGRLVLAFRRMAEEVDRREESLAELNRGLERLVSERTAELERQRDLQQLILANIADGVIVTDRAGRFLLWNDKAVEIVGSGPKPIPPDQWPTHFGIFRDESLEPIPTAELPLVRAVRGEILSNQEVYLRNPASQEGRWVQVTARPLLTRDGEIGGAVAVLLDVSEQRKWRERVESNRARLVQVGQLALGAGIASSAAHELSQPVAAISNYAAAALRLREQGRLEETELVDLLTRIATLAKHAGEVLDKLRALIPPSRGEIRPFNVNEIVESCLEFLDPRIQQQGVSVERRFGGDLPRPTGDPVELTHVLIQLVSNALQAMDKPAVVERRLAIETGVDAAKGVIEIHVIDSGPGINPDQVDQLFQPWRTDKPDALGIGLYIAQTVLEKYRGTISLCASEASADGAHFRVSLPTDREAGT